ncbi:radical SAM protein [Streptomyces sp. SID13726]|nr:radical SAM protein [Streptomyces sp. SID13726]
MVPADPDDRGRVHVPRQVLRAAARLRADGHEITVRDQRLPEPRPDKADPDLVVIFTAVTGPARHYAPDLTSARVTAERARQLFPAARTMAVGPHGTHLPGATLLDLRVDHVAVGAADSAAVHGVRDLTAGTRAPVLYGGLPRPAAPVTVVGNHPRPYPDLSRDRWPPPAYDLVPLGRYTAEVTVDGLLRTAPAATVWAASCPTAEQVVAEVETQHAAGLPELLFLDHAFGADAAFHGEIRDRLRGRGIGWTARTRADIVLAADLRRWREAGCQGVWLNSRVPERDLRDAVLSLDRAGITPFVSVPVGLPDDEACRSDQLVEHTARIPARFRTRRFTPTPGTPEYADLAPALNGGTAPATWREVRDVTRRYREEYPADLDDQERRLAALPNHLAEAPATTGREISC